MPAQLVGAEILGENLVAFVVSSQVPELATLAKGKNLQGLALRIKMWFRVRISESRISDTWKWELRRRKKATGCIEKYLTIAPNGDFSEIMRFHQIRMLLENNNKTKAVALFNKYQLKNKYPNSNLTKYLYSQLFENSENK